MSSHLPEEAKCYGCGACVNVCPTGALSMEYSTHAFLYYVLDSEKCIGCNKCESACPSLNPVFDNEKTPSFFSYCASDEIRKLSSSGGMFTVLARYVFKRGGVVCAAAFDESFVLRHQFVYEESGLDRFRGSKYLQSDTGSCYKEIEKLLQEGVFVLFVGTPCQVAGLRGALGRKYENLLLVDLLCHGVPSQLFFDGYLAEVAGERRVEDVQFRSKRAGWSWSQIITSFDDGSEHIGKSKGKIEDPYIIAFNKNLMMRYSCYDCSFCDYPRQGDITIGDLWESAKLDPDSNDGKGTSFVFLNNVKGKETFEELKLEASYWNEIKISKDEYASLPNRVTPKVWRHPGRRRFIDMARSAPFSKAVAQCREGTYDIGLPCVLYGDNIGSVLTYYAFYHVLTTMGYSVLLYEKPKDSSLKNSDKAVAFSKRRLPPWNQPVQYNTLIEMRELNDKCGQFVVGSDQIFLQSMSNLRNDFFFLEYVDGTRKKISYATSFGGPGARGTSDYYAKLQYYLNKFDFLSCRENDGVAFANNQLELNQPVHLVVDPVFLCPKSVFTNLVEASSEKHGGSYIGVYAVKPRERLAKLIDWVSEKTAISDVECSVHQWGSKASKTLARFNCRDSFPPEQTLETLFNSSFYITDSYHGVCFSLLFHKDFLVIPRDFEDRFVTLLEPLGLSNRIVAPDLSNLSEDLLRPINYDVIDNRLGPLVEESRRLLEDSLAAPGKALKYHDVDFAMQQILKLQRQVDDLANELKRISNGNREIGADSAEEVAEKRENPLTKAITSIQRKNMSSR